LGNRQLRVKGAAPVTDRARSPHVGTDGRLTEREYRPRLHIFVLDIFVLDGFRHEQKGVRVLRDPIA
jgi:hypothetical protein